MNDSYANYTGTTSFTPLTASFHGLRVSFVNLIISPRWKEITRSKDDEIGSSLEDWLANINIQDQLHAPASR